jgi:hypothetical protein
LPYALPFCYALLFEPLTGTAQGNLSTQGVNPHQGWAIEDGQFSGYIFRKPSAAAPLNQGNFLWSRKYSCPLSSTYTPNDEIFAASHPKKIFLSFPELFTLTLHDLLNTPKLEGL